MKRKISVYVGLCTALAVSSILIAPAQCCEGNYIDKFFLTLSQVTYKEAKHCCYKLNMDMFRVVGKKDIREFQRVIQSSQKSKTLKRFSFWIKKDFAKLSNDLAEPRKCPMLQWSTVGKEDAWTATGFCGLKYRALCVPLSPKKYMNLRQGQLTYGKRRKRDVASDLDGDMCHLSPTLNGYYISGEKLNFQSAQQCCASKGLEMTSATLSQAEKVSLKHSLCYTFLEVRQPLWVNTSTNGTVCTTTTLEGGAYLRWKNSSCSEKYPALCKKPWYDVEICDGIQYKELEGGAYIFSDSKLPYSEASLCCQSKEMTMVSLYTHRESAAMYKIMVQNGLPAGNLNFWTSGVRKFNSSHGFQWNDGRRIALNDYSEFCVGALDKLNTKSFIVTDYGCEQPLNFLCIDKEISRDFSRSKAESQEQVSGGDVLVQEGPGQPVDAESDTNGVVLKRHTTSNTEGGISPTENWDSEFLNPGSNNNVSVQDALEYIFGKDAASLIQDHPEDDESGSNDVASDEIPTNSLDVANIENSDNKDPPWQYRACGQIRNLNPRISLKGALSVEDALKLSLLNRIYNLKNSSAGNSSGISASSMGAAAWKQKFLYQLGRIFSEVCGAESYLFQREFVHVMVGLNSIYQSSFPPGPLYDMSVWIQLYKDLVHCQPEKLELKAHAYEVYAMVEKVAFTTPDKTKQLFPPEELTDRSSDFEIDPIIDSLWWMTTTVHAACYDQSRSNVTGNNSPWPIHFKAAMMKDFFEPIFYRWHHSGHGSLFFGPIVGNFDLERAIKNMRYCATAAYWQSKIIDRELVRSGRIDVEGKLLSKAIKEGN